VKQETIFSITGLIKF